MLINERKFDIRMWVLITHDHRCFLFKEGYIRMSSKPYTLELEKLENLALHDNKITTLPKELRTIESLTELTFQGNTLMQNEFEELTEWLEAKQPPVPVTRWTGGASGWD